MRAKIDMVVYSIFDFHLNRTGQKNLTALCTSGKGFLEQPTMAL
jgi:hypothetical protein